MKLRTLLLFLLTILSLSTYAQNDKSADAEKQAMQQMMAAMMGGQNCEIAGSYTFDHDFDMAMHHYDKKGKEDTQMTARCFLSDDGSLFGYELLSSSEKKTPAAKMIMQMDTRKMVTLIDQEGQKMALCMNMDSPLFQASDRQVDDPVQKMKRTGKKKTILGYVCDEWQNIDEDATSSFWISEKTTLPMGKYYKAMSTMKSSPFGGGQELPSNGMMMLMESVSKKGEKTVMEVTAIHPQRNSKMSTAGYQKF
ncbi:MAG: DUF4412 domain-containing protein [Saprospiraceae bacterium]|nr:DUF4412 domain-containing protein [Saprospiraceae bacterium]